MRYTVSHTTRYVYEAPVSQCLSEVRLTPRSLPWQRVIEFRIDTLPPSRWLANHKDYFGNDVTTLGIFEGHDRFITTATSVVEVESPPDVSSHLTWEAVRELLARHEDPETIEAFELTCGSPFVPLAPALAELAGPSFATGRPLVAAVQDLAHRIHAEFEYRPHTTSIESPLLETLAAKRGVCQDFAHIMIGALRAMGQAARYVSGYLRSGASYQGAEASHAWVSVFVPRAGWFDIDPTNDLRPSGGHVTVAWGRDYGDVTPVKGVALGGGRQLVDVSVRVAPVDSPSS